MIARPALLLSPILGIALGLTTALAAPVTAKAGPTAAPVGSPQLQRVQAHLRSLDSMVADFSQTDRNGKVLTGTLTLKKPGKIRFQYQKGVPVLIVGDGKALWFIDYSVKQVQRWPIGNSPLGILLDPHGDLARVARVVTAIDPQFVQVEARDPKHPEYGQIALTFVHNAAAPQGLSLAGWVATDAQNNRTVIRLSNVRFNGPIADNAFRWNDPRPRGR